MKHETSALLELLSKSPFIQIRDAAKLLLTKEAASSLNLSPGWNWREKLGLNSQSELSNQEDIFLGLLIIKPRTRKEILEKLWKDQSSLENSDYAINRLKRLISRLRQKRVGLICFEKNKYYLSNRYEIDLTQNKSITSIQITNNKIDLKLSKMEATLQNSLRLQPLSLYQIVDKIYGEKSNIETHYQVYVNRIKQLLARVRKKKLLPIQYRQGFYYLGSSSKNLNWKDLYLVR
jgi:hypothetical protein